MTLYDYDAVSNLLAQYRTMRGVHITTIEGALLDNYIATADGCKTAVIKEVYLNEWSSAYTVRLYNNIPAKYATVATLVSAGDYEGACSLFFGGGRKNET